MTKYTIFIANTLQGNPYTEKCDLACTHKAYNTIQEAINAVANDIEITYNNKSYRGLKVTLPTIGTFSNGEEYISTNGYFSCTYSFGPEVVYDIYINKIKL